MAEIDNRAMARQYTAQLLKMLRGRGPVPEPASEPVPTAANKSTAVAEARAEPTPTAAKPAAVAEARAPYTRLPELTPNRSNSRACPGGPTAESQQPLSRPPPRAAIATVGERLQRPQQGILGQLLAQANQFKQLTQIFHAYLPPPLRDHAVLIRLDAECWLVHTDSSSWATRLRYALHNSRQALGQHLGLELPKPRIRVVPASLPQRPQRPPLTLTEQSIQCLENAAHTIPDPRLSAALLRLAEHGRRRKGPA